MTIDKALTQIIIKLTHHEWMTPGPLSVEIGEARALAKSVRAALREGQKSIA